MGNIIMRFNLLFLCPIHVTVFDIIIFNMIIVILQARYFREEDIDGMLKMSQYYHCIFFVHLV